MKLVSQLTLVIVILLFQVANSGALEELPSFPATGVWNGFNDQLNVLECSNFDSLPVSLAVDLYRNNGTLVQSKTLLLSAGGTNHLVLNTFRDSAGHDLTNDYGTFQLSTSSDDPHVGCLTAFYHLSSTEAAPEYSFIIPVSSPTLGDSWGMYNSYDPSPKPKNPTYNWLSIDNRGTDRFAATVFVYAQDSSLLRTIPISLAPKERTDLALGHEQGFATGLYKIAPSNPNQPYGASLARYNIADPQHFNYASWLPSVTGLGGCQAILPISTMANAVNWAELGNPTDNSIGITATFRNQVGTVIYQESRIIASRGQDNLFINSFLDPAHLGAIGTLEIRCSDPNSRLLAQSSFYGNDASRVEWSYTSQAHPPIELEDDDELGANANTFFDAANWLKLRSSESDTQNLDIEVIQSQGSALTSQIRDISPNGTLDFPAHETLSRNSIGHVTLSPLRSNNTRPLIFDGELLRVIYGTRGVAEIVQSPVWRIRRPGRPSSGGGSSSSSSGSVSSSSSGGNSSSGGGSGSSGSSSGSGSSSSGSGSGSSSSGGISAPSWSPASYPWPMYGQNARRTNQSPFTGPRTSSNATSRNWTYTASAGVMVNMQPTVTADGVFFGTWGVRRLTASSTTDPNNWDKYDGRYYGLKLTKQANNSAQQLFSPLQPSFTQTCYTYSGREKATRDQQWCGADNDLHVSWYNGTVEGTACINPDDGTHYVGRGDGKVYAVNPQSGTVKWSFQTFNPQRPTDPDGGGEVIGGPLMTPTRSIIFATVGLPHPGSDAEGYDRETNAVYAIDTSGNLLWRYPSASPRLSNGVMGPPALSADGNTVYIATFPGDATVPGELIALDLTKPNSATDAQRTKWSLSMRNTARLGSPFVYCRHLAVDLNNTIYCGGGEGYIGGTSPIVIAVRDNGTSASYAWSPISVELQPWGTAPSHVVGGMAIQEVGGQVKALFVSTTHINRVNLTGGTLYALNPNTGAILASFDPSSLSTPGYGGMTPPIIDASGTVYVGIRGYNGTSETSGYMYAVDYSASSGFTHRWSFQVDHQLDWAAPTIGANGGLFFGSSDNFSDVAFAFSFYPGQIPVNMSPKFYALYD